MTATVLSQGDYGTTSAASNFSNKQDPETGEMIRVWTTDTSEAAGTQLRDIQCIARGILDGGIRVAGTTERFNPQGIIESVDYVKIQFPASEVISKRDRITNIRNRKGTVIWTEEEYNGAPTVFEVLGVTPVTDPFGNHVENSALLQRAEVQT
jgi:hypothetical protein